MENYSLMTTEYGMPILPVAGALMQNFAASVFKYMTLYYFAD